MTKQRIIILMHYMELGGAETSLVGLLHALDPARVDVDLFIYSHQGPLMQYIPDWVNLLPEKKPYSVIERPISEAVKKREFGVAFGRMIAKIRHRRYRKSHPAQVADASIFQYVGDCVAPWLPKINPDVEYDLCISYLNPHNIGRDKVRAKKKLAWIHTDYSVVSVNVDAELKIWGAYDHIAAISDDVHRAFVEKFPELADRIVDIENILPADYIRRKADEIIVNKDSNHVNILSIGRFCEAKNYDNVPDIARHLVEDGLTGLRWYIIGYGGDEELIRQKISEAGMEEHVILLGKKENPYPYIKACDIYVQPSRYEGKSITVREAQILCKPVAITNYPTAPSQIEDGVDGVIVPLDNEGCAKGLAKFIADTNLQQRIVEYLHTHDYANATEVEKIYNLLK